MLAASYPCALQAVAVGKAERTKQPVDHPIATQIRQASCNPEQAVHFFTQVLHPAPQIRCSALQATQHPYLHTSMQKLAQEVPAVPAAAALVAAAAAPITATAEPSAAAVTTAVAATDGLSAAPPNAASVTHLVPSPPGYFSTQDDSSITTSVTLSHDPCAQQKQTLLKKLCSLLHMLQLSQAFNKAKQILLSIVLPKLRLLNINRSPAQQQPNPHTAKWVSECAALTETGQLGDPYQ